jgi:hypothetical protein
MSLPIPSFEPKSDELLFGAYLKKYGRD